MVELLDIHFNFLCRKQRVNKKGQLPIVLRIVYRQERRDIFTGLYCDSKDWDAEALMVKLRSKTAETINKNLERITQRAVHVLDQLKFSRTPFTIDELVSGLKGDEERPVLLVEYLQNRSKELGNQTEVNFGHATYENYDCCTRFVIDFMEKIQGQKFCPRENQ
ncbi:MAG TPA: Arm DNA-binding domain-containing protein [Chitinophagaceae bacterium]|nr:Arm DNA-binding domain-containing protein [Chitinophagaceae bacterium]